MNDTIVTTKHFWMCLCEAYGLDPSYVNADANISTFSLGDGVAEFNVKLTLTPQKLQRAAELMKGTKLVTYKSKAGGGSYDMLCKTGVDKETIVDIIRTQTIPE